MAVCATCGNEYDKTFDVVMDGTSTTFDSFECAIHALAPVCEHCGVRILGHGVEGPGGTWFCSAHCAGERGVEGATDRVTAG